MESRSIAIDGPSGAGKSTISKLTAKKYNLTYVDTGAIYRCVGLYVFRKGISSTDSGRIIGELSKIEIEMVYGEDGLQHMLLCGKDVTDDIRLPQISIYASDVSKIPEVRAFLLDMQREMARKYDVIMDGRDIGTVVLPNAGLKIFLTATAEDRAQRRYLELREKGIETTYEEVLKDVNYRDYNDSHRETAPLRPAEGAIEIDTTGNTLEESVTLISRCVGMFLQNK